MSVAVSMFRWLDLLEKEFDKGFVELDLILGEIDSDQCELTQDGRQKMTSLSSSFAQLAHKAQTIFQTNAKTEAELIGLRSSMAEAQAKVTVLEKELKNTFLQLHAVQLQLHSTGDNIEESGKIKSKLENELKQFRQDATREAKLRAEKEQYEKENRDLRIYALQLQGETYGARLAAKYLDKELAGRIQQIQLLGREIRGSEHDILWNQIEAEIHLQRHKTVIRACRGRQKEHNKKLSTPDMPQIDETDNTATVARKKRGICNPRLVKLHRDKSEGLGISITGGKEHGVPIIISEIHEDMPAERCKELYIGDAILMVNNHDLQSASHSEAVHVLSRVHGDIEMEVLFVNTEDSSEDEEDWEQDYNQRYSSVGLVDDPNILSLKGDIVMTNSPSDPKSPSHIQHIVSNSITKPNLFESINTNSTIDVEIKDTSQKLNHIDLNDRKYSETSNKYNTGRYPGTTKRVNTTLFNGNAQK